METMGLLNLWIESAGRFHRMIPVVEFVGMTATRFGCKMIVFNRVSWEENVMKVYSIVLVLALGSLAPLSLRAQAVDATSELAIDEAAIHDELRALREALAAAVISGDVEQQLPHIHENVVATWPNNEVVRGRDQLREFLDKGGSGEDRVFQGYQKPPSADGGKLPCPKPPANIAVKGHRPPRHQDRRDSTTMSRLAAAKQPQISRDTRKKHQR